MSPTLALFLRNTLKTKPASGPMGRLSVLVSFSKSQTQTLTHYGGWTDKAVTENKPPMKLDTQCLQQLGCKPACLWT